MSVLAVLINWLNLRVSRRPRLVVMMLYFLVLTVVVGTVLVVPIVNRPNTIIIVVAAVAPVAAIYVSMSLAVRSGNLQPREGLEYAFSYSLACAVWTIYAAALDGARQLSLDITVAGAFGLVGLHSIYTLLRFQRIALSAVPGAAIVLVGGVAGGAMVGLDPFAWTVTAVGTALGSFAALSLVTHDVSHA